MLRAESARWTSAKFVVQYPKPSTKPSPNTSPTQSEPSGLVTWWMPTPCQAWSPGSPSLGNALILFLRPSIPPMAWSATSVSGSRLATITKNCRTSL